LSDFQKRHGANVEEHVKQRSALFRYENYWDPEDPSLHTVLCMVFSLYIAVFEFETVKSLLSFGFFGYTWISETRRDERFPWQLSVDGYKRLLRGGLDVWLFLLLFHWYVVSFLCGNGENLKIATLQVLFCSGKFQAILEGKMMVRIISGEPLKHKRFAWFQRRKKKSSILCMCCWNSSSSTCATRTLRDARYGLRAQRVGEASHPGPWKVAVRRAGGVLATLSCTQAGQATYAWSFTTGARLSGARRASAKEALEAWLARHRGALEEASASELDAWTPRGAETQLDPAEESAELLTDS
jgi:hypothetical protein